MGHEGGAAWSRGHYGDGIFSYEAFISNCLKWPQGLAPSHLLGGEIQPCYFRRIMSGWPSAAYMEGGFSSRMDQRTHEAAPPRPRPAGRRFPRSFGRLGAEYKSKFPLRSSSPLASQR